MLREIKRSAATYGICIGIVAIGFCGYTVLSIASDRLMASRDAFFERTAFPDMFAEVEEAPAALAGQLAQLPGVSSAEARLTALISVGGLEEDSRQDSGQISWPQLKLTSIAKGGMAWPLLFNGLPPQPGARELILGDGFFQARKFRLGQEIKLINQGRQVSFTVVGSGISPENIYLVRTINEMLPDPANYDAAFLDYETLAAFLGKEGLANEFLLRLEAGADKEELKERLEKILEPYGFRQAYEGVDQFSVQMLQQELTQLGRVASVMPMLFLAVAAVILYISLGRLIEQQRVQVGTLLALGIRMKAIERHYLSYGAFVGGAGGLLGGLLGYLAAEPLVNFYRVYFRLPEIPVTLSPKYLIQGAAAALLFCGAIAWFTAGSLSRLEPAEALRPAAPKTSRLSLLERLPGFRRLFTVPGLMAVRSLSRNRRRSALALTGIAFAYMITACLVSMYSLYDVFLFDYLEKTQRQDLAVYFSRPVAAGAALEAVRGQDIQRAEGIMEFAVTLKGPSGKLEAAIQGIPGDSELCRLYDENGARVYVQPEGLVLSRFMAGQLGVSAGDLVETEVTYPRKQQAKVPVTGIIAQYMGSTAYMSHEAVAGISSYNGAYTSVLLTAGAEARPRLAASLAEAPAVSGVESRWERLEKYREMMGMMNGVMAMMCMLGVIIGFAVIYISSLISYEELRREIAAMMMLGLKGNQCLEVISTGQWLLTIGAIIPGVPMTLAASRLISRGMASEVFIIPDFVDAPSLILALGLTFLAVYFSSGMMLKKIKALEPVDLLRERE